MKSQTVTEAIDSGGQTESKLTFGSHVTSEAANLFLQLALVMQT